MNSIRILLSLAANRDWSFHYFYVTNTFLHGNLEEEVFIDVSLRFEGQFKNEKVCKLKKFLYDLKQLSRTWFQRFTQSLVGFKYM